MPASADNAWTSGDTAREAVYAGLLVLDWRQTRRIAQDPEHYFEKDSKAFIGEHPTTGQVDAYFALMAVGHAAVSYVLPRDWREGWQYVYIGMELRAVHSNYQIGLRLTW